MPRVRALTLEKARSGMGVLEDVVRQRLAQSEDQIRYALRMARLGNPLAGELDTRRREERLQAKAGLTPREAEAIAEDVMARAVRLEDERVPRPHLDRRERVWGDTIDFVSVAFLERGARTARSVGRIGFQSGKPQGTGVLIGAGLLLTNNHVIEASDQVPHLIVEFDYEQDLSGVFREVSRFRLDPDVFVTDPVEGLDFTIVGVGPRIIGPEPLEAFGYSGLSDARDKHMIGEFANIVQHPNGRHKEVVLRENRLVNRFDDALHYVADTEPGSSGSPVYNSEWRMIALHHWGGPWIDAEGNEPADFEVNEGIRISSIVRKLHSRLQHLPELTRMRLSKALELGRGEVLPSRPEQMEKEVHGTSPRIDPDGRVTWTIPVELSVRLPGLPGLAVAQPAIEPVSVSDPVAPVSSAEEADDYSNRTGYSPGFLPVDVPLPRLRDSVAGDAARKLTVTPGEDPHELKYHHFSVVVNRRRKLAFFTACNIDGRTAKSIKRSTRAVSDLEPTDPGLREAVASLDDAEADSWSHDPRLSRSDYSGVEIYAGQLVPNFPKPQSKGRILRMFQKGHLVRRLDPAWGTANTALAAERDTFHWTNAAPQVGFFNMGKADENQPGTGNGNLWRAAENYVLRNATAEQERVTSFTGPIFREDDRLYRNIQIPGRFFKVTAWVENGALRSLALIVDQEQVFREWPEAIAAAGSEAFQDPGELSRVSDFLSTVEEVEELTGIDFGEEVRNGDIRKGEGLQEVASADVLPLMGGPVSTDDLTMINGIGEEMARRLRDFGITTFSQIAAWTTEDSKEMEARLDTRGRILRYDWIGQAKRLSK